MAPPPRTQYDPWVVAVWVLGGALSVAVWLAMGALVVFLVFGCATARVVTSPTNEVEVTCAAIGQDAEVTYFAPETSGVSVGWTVVQKSVTCKGGPILPSFIGAVGSVFKLVLGLFMVVP